MSTTRRTLITIGSFALGVIVMSLFLHQREVSIGTQKNAASIVSSCSKANDKDACLIQSFETYAKNFGTKTTLAEVHHAIITDPSLGGTCHNIMHHIGHVALLELGSFKAAYDVGNYDCGNGYFHGVVEEAFKDKEDDAFSPAHLSRFCDSVKAEATTTKDYALLNCVHGLGHALVYKYEGNLAASLPSCTNFKHDNERTQCLAGAFMENMIERLPNKDQSDPKQNPSLTCSSVAGDLYRCWAALAGFALSSETGNTNEAVLFCRSFDSSLYRDACGEGIGKAVRVGRESALTAQVQYCKTHTQEFAPFCTRGANAAASEFDSPFYSEAFGMLAWPSATGTDLLIGSIKKLE